MWMASVLQIVALSAVDPGAPLAASTAPAPIYWRQTLFSIPFHLQQSSQPSQEPVEVQLYVSPDRGVHWDNWRQSTPQKGYFLFRAGNDGEYWFDVRTRDRSGQVRPQGPHTPKLVVIVDTTPPKVQLKASRGDAGQVTAAFRIEEPYPKLDSMAIEYRLGPTAPWQTVLVGPNDVHTNNAEHTGEVTWYPQNAWGTMEIRLRVNDMAGNPAESHTQVVLAAAGGAATNPVRPAGAAAAATPAPLGRQTPVSPAATMVAAPPASPTTAATSPVAVKSADASQPSGSRVAMTPWPPENANSSSSTVRSSALETTSGSGSVSIRINPPATQQFVADRPPESPSPPVEPNPFKGFTAARPSESATTPATGGEVGPPPGVKLRWINTRVFQLTYDTRAMGSTGNVPVELWGTRDGGKSWRSFGNDPKGQSPMLVTVPNDGIYGFRMTLDSGPSAASRPPAPGDAPGIWIGVDLTRPVGRITAAQQGKGSDSGKLFIAWEASDNRELAARPISLSYGERLGGPWTSIASGLENTRQYAWQLTGRVPQRIHLRLEILDAAGNMGVYETPEPIVLDVSNPAMQLGDLRPLTWIDPPGGERTFLR